jgi:hypothetical protein
VEQVRVALASQSMGPAIKAFRDAMMFNIEHVEDYLIENIDCLMEGKTRPDWHCVPSLKYCGVLEDPWAHETTPQLVELGYKGFNLVHYQARFFAMAQKLGPVHLQEQDAAAMERLVQAGDCIINHSIQALKIEIDAL